MNTVEPSTGKWRGAVPAILIGGLIAGAFDISYATGFSYAAADIPPATILQSVASGLLGQAAYEGGAQTAILGLIAHFVMMLMIAAIYVGVRRIGPAILYQSPLLLGPLYGVAVYCVMNRVVMPLSAFPMKTPYVAISFTSLAVHMFLIGLPMAWAAAKFDTATPR